MTEVVLWVDMTCGGCEAAVKRILTKMEGVEGFDIDLEHKKVAVRGDVTAEACIEKISKMGKETKLYPKGDCTC